MTPKEPQRTVSSKAELNAVLDWATSEAQWTKEVMAYAQEHGWMAAHFRPARTEKGWRTPMSGDVGFPDLVFARAGVVIFAELKAMGAERTVTEYQRRWLEATGGFLWTPKDRAEMERTLA